MKTKLFSLFVVVLITTNVAFAADCYIDGILYDLYGDEATVTCDNNLIEYTGHKKIPSSITYQYKTYRVVAIAPRAFKDCPKLTGVTIGNSVTTIGYSAFENCPKLTSVTIPNSVTEIGSSAFEECSGLTSVTIGNSVTTIGISAFYNCTGLTSITIPNSVTTIGKNAFYNCTGLTSIDVDAANTHYVSIDGVLFNHAKDTLIQCPAGNSRTEYIIPNSVTTIGDRAFYYCYYLRSVSIPNSITGIGYDAFKYCDVLISVTINSNTICERLVSSVFGSQVTEYIIGDSVTTIGDYAFYKCIGLTSVTIGNSVTTIGNSAFYDCSGLTSVTIPSSVTTIGDRAFSNCSGLTSVTIPNSVTTIGEMAFYGCSGLKSIDVATGNTHFCSIDGVLLNYTKDTLIQYPIGNSRTEYTIPNSVATIGRDAFSGCSGLTSVTIGNSVTTIGDYAFYRCSGLTSVTIGNSVATIGREAFEYCSGLTSVTIGNSVTTIGSYAFHDCYRLTSITIPNSVTTIGWGAFEDCRGLTSITSSAAVPPTCDYDCFSNVDKTIPVYVPVRSVDAYKQANDWKDFTNIQAIKQGQCGTNLYWQYNDGVLVISGTGAMYDYTQGSAPWMLFFQDSISSLVINNGCTTIGNFAFYGLSNKNFKTIDVPNGVEQIGQFAFANCEYIKNVYLGLSLEKISANAFANDERLLYITCYAIEPPLLDESAFVNYDAYLSVPCAAQADYKVAKGWKLFNKENVSCIGAEEKPITGDEVTVDPSADNVTITWPANDDAAEYKLVITKDGIVFCTLTFNAQGQLTGIAFAPNRAGSRMLDAAVMTANGWQFTVTGLDQASKYGYALDALNASKQSIKHYEGEFATDGYTSLEWVTSDKIQGINKMLLNGHLYILRGYNLFTATGARVK